jgi:hypothetical protein
MTPLTNFSTPELTLIDASVNWILHGGDTPNPLPLADLEALCARITPLLPETSPDDREISCWALNYLSFTHSRPMLSCLPPNLDTSQQALVNRVQCLPLVDSEHSPQVALDATAFRLCFLGEVEINEDLFLENFKKRFYLMDLQKVLYIFEREPALADFFKFSTNLVDELKKPSQTISQLLSHREWVDARDLADILYDLTCLGPSALKEFFLVQPSLAHLFIADLSIEEANQLLQLCAKLQAYKENPDLVCVKLLAFLIENDFKEVDPCNYKENAQNLLTLLNNHPLGSALFSSCFETKGSIAALQLAVWKLHNLDTPLNLPVSGLCKFIVFAENFQSLPLSAKAALFNHLEPFPFEEFLSLSKEQKYYFLKHGIFSKNLLHYFIEQAPDELKKILEIFEAERGEYDLSREDLEASLFISLANIEEHPLLDFSKIIGKLGLNIPHHLHKNLTKASKSTWEPGILKMFARFSPYLTLEQKLPILLLRSAKNDDFLFEALQNCPIDATTQEFLVFLHLLNSSELQETDQLLELLRKTEISDDLILMLSTMKQFKNQFITFGQEFLSKAHERGLISPLTLLVCGQTLPMERFCFMIARELSRFSVDIVMNIPLVFNQKNDTVWQHLNALLATGFDAYTTFYLQLLRDSVLGDGLFVMFLLKSPLQDFALLKILTLIPQNFIPFFAHFLPDSRRKILFDPFFQRTLVKAFPELSPPVQKWFTDNHQGWIPSTFPPLDAIHEKLASADPQRSMVEKSDILEETESKLQTYLLRREGLLKTIEDLEKATPSSPLASVLKTELEKNGPRIEAYKNLLSKIHLDPSLCCPLSGALLTEPVKICDDTSATVFQHAFLKNLLGNKTKAQWPHDPSQTFTTADIEPLKGEEKGELESRLHRFELSMDALFAQFRDGSGPKEAKRQKREP